MKTDQNRDLLVSVIALITCLFVLLCTLTASAQPPRGTNAAPIGTVYQWRALKAEGDQLGLFLNGKQVGVWIISSQEYWPLTKSGAWGDKSDAPYPLPEWAVNDHQETWYPKDVPSVMNFGITPPDHRDPQRHSSMEINGRPASREAVLDALEKGVPTDSHKYRLTVIGTDAEREKVIKDWEKAPAELREVTLLWSVPPDHPSLHDNYSGAAMFVNTGKPTVYFTDSTGKVLYHEDDYQGPGDIEAIRKRKAEYEAKRDPGRTLPGMSASVHPSLVGGGTALAMAAGLYFSRRKK